jgi:hypothetical protein
MEAAIRGYFAACDSGDARAIAAFFVPDAVHYFPPGMYGGPFRGAHTIGARWAEAVDRFGSSWTVDTIITDAKTRRAVIEWTHFQPKIARVLRGDEWYVFSDGGLIVEIRAYYASPKDPGLRSLQLDGFPYIERGYPMVPRAAQ